MTRDALVVGINNNITVLSYLLNDGYAYAIINNGPLLRAYPVI